MERYIEVWEGLAWFSSLLSLMTSVVEQSTSVEFLDDMRMGRASKTLRDKPRIQNQADMLKNVLVKEGWIVTEPSAEKYSQAGTSL